MVFEKFILDEVKKEARGEKKTHYWLPCPGCGRLVVRKELMKKGCYICGWHGTEDEIRAARARENSQLTEDSTVAQIKGMTCYKIDCPQCQTRLVREQLIEKGCYICGWRPK